MEGSSGTMLGMGISGMSSTSIGCSCDPKGESRVTDWVWMGSFTWSWGLVAGDSLSDSFSLKELKLEDAWSCIGMVIGIDGFEDSLEVGKGMSSGEMGMSDKDSSLLLGSDGVRGGSGLRSYSSFRWILCRYSSIKGHMSSWKAWLFIRCLKRSVRSMLCRSRFRWRWSMFWWNNNIEGWRGRLGCCQR